MVRQADNSLRIQQYNRHADDTTSIKLRQGAEIPLLLADIGALFGGIATLIDEAARQKPERKGKAA